MTLDRDWDYVREEGMLGGNHDSDEDSEEVHWRLLGRNSLRKNIKTWIGHRDCKNLIEWKSACFFSCTGNETAVH